MKRLLVLMLTAALLLTGCAVTRSYTAQDLTLTLPKAFADLSQEAYGEDAAFLYGAGGCFLLGVREDKQALLSHYPDLTLQDFGTLVIAAHQLDCKLTVKDGFYCFTYTAEGITYLSVVLEGSSSFWTVQGYCASDKFAENKDALWLYLTTAKVS